MFYFPSIFWIEINKNDKYYNLVEIDRHKKIIWQKAFQTKLFIYYYRPKFTLFLDFVAKCNTIFTSKTDKELIFHSMSIVWSLPLIWFEISIKFELWTKSRSQKIFRFWFLKIEQLNNAGIIEIW